MYSAHRDTHLILQNKYEDVVSSNSEHQEGHNLQNDQRGGDADPRIETHRGKDRAADNQDPTQTHQKFGIHLQNRDKNPNLLFSHLSEPFSCVFYCIVSFVFYNFMTNKPVFYCQDKHYTVDRAVAASPYHICNKYWVHHCFVFHIQRVWCLC